MHHRILHKLQADAPTLFCVAFIIAVSIQIEGERVAVVTSIRRIFRSMIVAAAQHEIRRRSKVRDLGQKRFEIQGKFFVLF